MDIERLKSEVKTLLDMVKIPDEEKNDLRGKLESSTSEQLEQLKDNLLRQATADIYLDFMDEINKSDKMLDESQEQEILQKLHEQVEMLKGKIITSSEIDNLKKQLADLTQQLQSKGQPTT